MTKEMTLHRHRSWSTRAVLTKLGPNESITAAVIAAYVAQIDGFEVVDDACDDARTDVRTKEVKLERQGKTLWGKLIQWYAVARAMLSADWQYLLDQIRTGGGFTLPRVERRARQTRTVLAALPEGATVPGFTTAQLQAEIASLLDGFGELDDLNLALRTAETNLATSHAALDAENKRIYAILAALFTIPGTVEYDLVHTIPTEGEDDEEEDDDDSTTEQPQLPPEK